MHLTGERGCVTSAVQTRQSKCSPIVTCCSLHPVLNSTSFVKACIAKHILAREGDGDDGSPIQCSDAKVDMSTLWHPRNSGSSASPREQKIASVETEEDLRAHLER